MGGGVGGWGRASQREKKRDRCYATDILNKLLKRWGGGECMHARARGGGGEETGGAGGGERQCRMLTCFSSSEAWLALRRSRSLLNLARRFSYSRSSFCLCSSISALKRVSIWSAGRAGRHQQQAHTHTHPSQQHTNSDKWQCCPISPSKAGLHMMNWQSNIHTQSPTYTHTHTESNTHTHIQNLTHTHTNTHTESNTHTQSLTHTHRV